ncbi:hypothetical protein F6X37_33430 [Paraburkholderia sp. 31.1]|uniref:hypothetical protein n=1 Tax=Paraburkholderia sp. 31.1 TaxID=2615205 RepID=UPI001656684B|nr:hypothetical protein [Paraburkholderia sp. 31.1]MBC8726257.1 hypothetical protein [Paraburkholderia sp. 31.1]
MRKLYVIISALISGHVFACMPGENFDIYFPPNSAVIPADEVLRLANWVVDQKITYANHKTRETTLVGGHAEEREQNATQLAQARLIAGKAVLDQFGFLRGTVKTSSRVYSKNDVENGRRVEISFEPDCPNKCCTGQ